MDLYFTIVFLLFLFIGLYIMLTDNPVHAILALVLVFFLSSCLSLVLGVEFLAILILIVYVGAISVLFLFVVMLLNIRVLELNVGLLKYWWIGTLYSVFFLFNLFYTTLPLHNNSSISAPIYVNLNNQLQEWNSISQFGELVFLYYPHLLIIAALVLFIAIVSPVLLSFISFSRSKTLSNESARRQNIFLQTLRISLEKNFK